MAATIPHMVIASTVDETYAVYAQQAKNDLALFDKALAQGLQLLAGTQPGLVRPDNAFGPYNYKGVRKPFGWSVDTYNFGTVNQKFFVLTDVRQDVARAFNRAAIGRDAVLGWQGVGRGAEVLPYGLFTPEWGNAILLPVAWLVEQKHRLELRDAVRSGKSNLTGLALDSNELARHGLYFLDRFVAAGIVFSKVDMQSVTNGLESLLGYQFDTLQANSGRAIWHLKQQRTKCAALTEQFSRQDCMAVLGKAFSDFGSKVTESKRLLIASHTVSKGIWNATTNRLEFKNMAYRSAVCAHPNLVCEPFAKFGTGNERADSPDNLVCYRVSGGLPKDLLFGMTEAEARRISKTEFDAGQRNMASLLLRIDQAPVVQTTPQQCTEGRSRIVALGQATIESKLIWSARSLEFMQKP